MSKKLTITYDRGDALFELVEETEHGGIETSHVAFQSAAVLAEQFVRTPVLHHYALVPLMDGVLTSITLEAP